MKAITLPQPLAADAKTVTLSRDAWDALLEQVETAGDLAAVAANDRRRAAIGVDQFDRECVTADEAARVLNGESLITVYRTRQGITQLALARKAGVSQTYLNDLERGRKPGSASMLKKIADALGISMDVLVD
jgi:DNA-binding XRE family transcriptional regulator